LSLVVVWNGKSPISIRGSKKNKSIKVPIVMQEEISNNYGTNDGSKTNSIIFIKRKVTD